VAEEITNLIGQKERVGLIGVMPLVHNVSIVEEGSPAEKAGLKVGDKIISVDGTPIRGWADMKTAALDKPGQELEFKFERDGNEQTVRLTPDKKEVKDEKGKKVTIGVLGIGMSGEMVREQYGPIGATLRGLEVTGEMTYLTLMGIKGFIMGLLTGSVPKDQLGGPILIFQIYGEVTKQGFNELIRLTALLSISLGLLNLLPIPILDGGHILFFLIEIVKGKPVSEKNRERAAQVGLFMLLSLMVFVFYWDIMRIIG